VKLAFSHAPIISELLPDPVHPSPSLGLLLVLPTVLVVILNPPTELYSFHSRLLHIQESPQPISHDGSCSQ